MATSADLTVADLTVIGAGPAGLSTAAAAADAGLRVALVDAGPRLGGQYFRHPPAGLPRLAGLYHGWDRFAALAERLADHAAARRVVHLARHQVWSVERDAGGCTVRALHDDQTRHVTARSLLVATGAHDRSLPFPGWDLPGVMTAGGAQALLKGNAVLPGRRVVVAGTGPFLLPVAAGLADAGAQVLGVHEANAPTRFARHAGAVAGNLGKLAEGAGYVRALARHAVGYRFRSAVVEARGDGALAAVTVARLDADGRPIPGTRRDVECDTLAVGYGFTPQLELPLALGCAVRVDADGSLVVDVDEEQATSVPGVFAAGEVTGVGGADLSLVEGELAGLAAARAHGARLPARALARGRARRRVLRAFAAALHDVYRVPPAWTSWPRGDTVVCRCEEVPRGRIIDAVTDLGVTDPRSVKLVTRAGMGWCQGRVCGAAVATLVAEAMGRPVTLADLRGLAHRPLAQPVPLRALR